MPISNFLENSVILRQKANSIEIKPNRIDLKLVDILKRELQDNSELAAISPQNLLLPNYFPPYNFYKQIIILKDFNGADYFTLFNPSYQAIGNDIDYWPEACGSIQLGEFPLESILPRPSKIEVSGINENGESELFIVEGEIARYLMHEVDHLNGVLISDYFSPQIYGLPEIKKTFPEFIPCFLKKQSNKMIISKYNPSKSEHKNQLHYFDYDTSLGLEKSPIRFRINGESLSLELNPNHF
ncbi:MAG: peptide deformylase [Nanoarchaeota archaeon]|nr:peptide deformylase [Nanoarchaeota archaeon]